MKSIVLLFVISVLVLGVLGTPTKVRKSIYGRIIGGQDAADEQFPYQVSVQFTTHINTGVHFCGGVIISPTAVLSAGHCFGSGNRTDIKVVAGITSFNETNTFLQEAFVNAVYIHPDYEGDVNPHDLAIVLLKSPFKFTAGVQPVSLPTSDSIPAGNATVSGWGVFGSSEDVLLLPYRLQYLNTLILPHEECREGLVALFGDSEPLHEYNVCTGPLSGGYSVCMGDSGGPLVQGNEIIGIVSWAIVPCGIKNGVSVYVGVSNYIDWILLYVEDIK